MLNFFSHHKCATRWLVDYLTRVAALNEWSFFHTDYHDQAPDRSADIAFFGNETYSRIVEQNCCGFHIIRNPLNIVISAYNSHRETHPTDNWPQLCRQRAVLSRSLETRVCCLRSRSWNARISRIGRLGRFFLYDCGTITTIDSQLRIEDATAQPRASFSPILPEIQQGTSVFLPADTTFSNFSGG